MMENDNFLPHSGYYPTFLSIEGRVCLVVGGGSVAERKIRVLVSQGAAVRLVAREMTDWISEQCEKGVIRFEGKDFDAGRLEGVFRRLRPTAFQAQASKPLSRGSPARTPG
jgi:siroheme synthase-like protein